MTVDTPDHTLDSNARTERILILWNDHSETLADASSPGDALPAATASQSHPVSASPSAERQAAESLAARLRSRSLDVQTVNIEDDTVRLKDAITVLQPTLVVNLVQHYAGDATLGPAVAGYIRLLGATAVGPAAVGPDADIDAWLDAIDAVRQHAASRSHSSSNNSPGDSNQDQMPMTTTDDKSDTTHSRSESGVRMNTIAVGIDFSKQSDMAARCAQQMARRTGARLVLVHAGEVPHQSDKADKLNNQAAKQWQRVVESRLRERERKLRALEASLVEEWPNTSHLIIDGVADVGLCKAAEQLDADLLVTGTHGRTGISRFLMGSVAERVVRRHKGNVMIARPNGADSGVFNRILVPTDFSMHAEKALEMALLLAAPGGAVDIFHAWDTEPEYALEWSGAILDELASTAQASGEQLLKRFVRDELTLGFDTVRAHPANGIAKCLADKHYDLVVMGSHGKRGFERFLLGSVAEKTVRHAPCSVIVVHADPDTDE